MCEEWCQLATQSTTVKHHLILIQQASAAATGNPLAELKSSVKNFQHETKQYKILCNKHFSGNGVPQSYNLFEGKHGIMMSLCMNGFLLSKKHGHQNGPSTTPIVLQIENCGPTYVRSAMS
jgi:hypothetical protein